MRAKLQNVFLSALLCLMSTSVWALDQVDGVYQIGSADDLREFAEIVASGDNAVNAVLTADIVCAADQPMIGVDTARYAGTFDGAGHTITLNAYAEADGQALFRNVTWTGVIKNLIVDGTITTNYKYAAGFVAWNQGGHILNCVSKVTIKSGIAGDGTHAGFVAINNMGAVVTNCLSLASIHSNATTSVGGIHGWTDQRCVLTNNLVIADIQLADPGDSHSICRNPGKAAEGLVANNFYLTKLAATTDAEGTQITEEQLKSGAVCFMLNHDQSNIQWTQDLENGDPYPMPFKTGKQVYADTPALCSGQFPEGATPTFSNTDTGVQHDAHLTCEDGKCDSCFYWNPTQVERDENNAYMLKTVYDMDWFAQYFTYGAEYQNASLYADIHHGEGRKEWLNHSNWYYGTFDGRGHTLDVEWVDVTTEYNGLVYTLGGGGVIRNLNMTGTITSQNHYTASFIGQTKGASLLENCVSSVDIVCTFAGDNTNGGLCGVNNGTFATYRNCIFAGTITSTNGGNNCGGLIGWSGATSVMQNVAMIGTLDVADGDNNMISRNPGNVDYTGGVYLVNDQFANANAGVKILSPDAATSGELCYAMRGADGTAFKQTLGGVDEHPWPFGDHMPVYADPSDGFRCDGTPQGDITYSNTPSEDVIPEHTYVDGFCEVCGNIDPDYLQPNEEGFYELSTGMDLAWFSQKINKTDNRSLNVKLMEDIEMDDEANERFIAIGTEAAPYTGTFDGDYHTIDYLYVNQPATRGVGLIGACAGPAVIENLTLGENCQLIGLGYVGLIGFSTPAGGTVHFTNLGNKGYVECTTGANAGGMVGCNMSSACTFIIDKCYSMATIVGTKENGAFSGWLGSNAVLNNCWAGTEVQGTDEGKEFARYNTNPTFNNCWTVQGTQVNNFSADQIETGQLAWRMNGEKFTSPIWYQNINDGDPHPVADSTRGVVYYVKETYGSVANEEDYTGLVQLMQLEAEEYLEDLVAEQALIDAYQEEAENLPVWESESVQENLDTLAKYYGLLNETRAKVKESADAYAKYVAKVAELQAYLESHFDFEGEERDNLDDYLQSTEEPNEVNPCGGALYITEGCLLTAEEVLAEIARIEAWLQTAINTGYLPGAEVTALMTNAKLLDGWNGWQGVTGSGIGVYDGIPFGGAEAWNKTFDTYQKVGVSKPGYYMITMTTGYRASNDKYSVNHIAQLYAGENNTYVPTVFETKISKEEAIDQVNANITGGTSDLPYPTDPLSETVDTAYFGMHGQLSVALAANSGRALTHILTYVEEGDSLLVGIRNEGSGYGSDWTGFANPVLTYLGGAEDEETEPGMDKVIAGQVARANTILTDYVHDGSDLYAKNPNFSQALKDKLGELVASSETVSGVEAKYALIQEFSKVFNEIIVCKRAYVQVFSAALAMEEACMSLVELEEVDVEAISAMVFDIYAAYEEGLYTTEEAIAKFEEINALPIMPDMVDGAYQIETKLHMVTYSAIVNGINNKANAVMMNDIDMTGVNLTPIGKDVAGFRFQGTFDGQGHKFSNLNIDWGGNYFGVFGCAGSGAVIKNFILDNTCRIAGASYGGIVGGANEAGTITLQQLGNEGIIEASVNEAAGIIGTNMGSAATYNIENCYVSGYITGGGNMAAICSWTGGKGYVKNCWSIAQVDNYDGTNYFYRNTNITATNCYDIKGASDEVAALDTALLKTGELTYKLNGSSSKNAVWLQTLGTDTVPRLFQGDTIYYYDKKYINEKPVIELNAYAYDLATASTENDVTITYTLNAPAKAAEVRFFNGEALAYTAVLAGEQLLPGTHSVVVENSLLPAKGTALTYEVAVTALGVLEGSKVGESVPVTSPYGMAINAMPESAAFGTLYLSQSERTDTTAAGLYAYAPDFKCVNATAYTGGLEMLSTDSATMASNDTLAIRINDSYAPLAPKTVRLSEDGRLFVGMANGMGSPIYEANPENLGEAWTPVFTGGDLDEYGVTWVGEDKQAGIVVSFATEGTGNDLKLYTLAGERTDSASTVTDYYAYYYNLGAEKSWTAAPSGQIDSLMNQYTSTPHNVNIETDGRGGLWYIQQAPSAGKETPSLKHYNAEGKEDFSNTAVVYPGAAIAKYNGGDIIAHPTGNSTIGIYAVNYAPNDAGKIFPEGLYTIPVSESVITAMAFDYAGNLYVASKDSKKMGRYVIPSLTGDKYAEQEFVTPSSARTNFTVGEVMTGIEDVNAADAKNEIYTIGGVRVQKAQKGVNIINGKKVLVK